MKSLRLTYLNRLFQFVFVLTITTIVFSQKAFCQSNNELGDHVRIENRWKGTFLHNENGSVELGDIKPDWWSAMWLIEPVEGNFVRIKNRWKGTYLHCENGKTEDGDIKLDWWSAMWELEAVEGDYVRIKNRWKNTYLHNEHGALELGEIKPDWWSAMWKVK